METQNSFTPHPVLSPHYEDLRQKQNFLRQVFDRSAVHYEKIATWGFFGTGDWYRKGALLRAGVKPGMKIVDIAAGTGITGRVGASIAGDPKLLTFVEPSQGMLEVCRGLMPEATHLQAPAENIPLEKDSFDFLTMGFALRHVEDLVVAFKEFHRVLKPGSKALILDITKPDNKISMACTMFYFKQVMPRLTRWMTGSNDAAYLMDYYWKTLDQMVPPERVLEALKEAGFIEPRRHVVIGMFSEYTAIKP